MQTLKPLEDSAMSIKSHLLPILGAGKPSLITYYPTNQDTRQSPIEHLSNTTKGKSKSLASDSQADLKTDKEIMN